MNKKLNKKVVVLINHASRKAKELSEQLKIEVWLKKHFAHYQIFRTHHLEDGERLYEACHKDNFDILLVLGGDGTASEVVHRLMASELKKKPKLAFLAAGTGCDFVRHLKKEFSNYSGLDWLLNAEAKKIDVGLLEYRTVENALLKKRYFINIAHVGFGGEVTRLANTKFRKLRTLSWAASALYESLAYKNQRALVSIDGKREVCDLFALLVGNGSYFGAGMHILPGAVVSDGQLEVLLIKDSSKFKLIRHLPRDLWALYRDKSMTNPFSFYSKAKSIDIMNIESGNLTVDIDGDTEYASELHYKIVPKALEVLIPGL